jgi:hypothetical protein
MPGPLVSEDGGTCHDGQPETGGTFTREPSALVDDTFAAREGRVSPYAHSATLTELMRWFTDAAYDAEEEVSWDTMLASYSAHVAALADSLPPDLRALATEPELNLHDAEFIEVAIDPPTRRVEMVVRLADPERSWLRLKFRDAEIVPDNYQALAYAIGAVYAQNDWGGVTTVVRALEVDRSDGRHVIRLRLWPFHEFAIEFGSMSLDRLPSANQPRGPGRFVLTGTEGQWNEPADRRVTFSDTD